MAQPRSAPIPAPPRRRYPIGALRPAAIKRGREIVAQHGADALTLRGLARDLGVSAPALIYYFRNREGLRAAVAETVHEQLATVAGVPPAVGHILDDTRTIGERWIEFAETNPNLYRLAFGDGWRSPGLGWRTGWMATRVPTDPLEHKLRRAIDRDRRWKHLPGDTPAALPRHVAAGIHGLATARLDGAPSAIVHQSLDLLLRSIPAQRAAS